MKRFQLSHNPLIVAWSVTIHKSQGLPLTRAVVNIGMRELAVGSTYVALSRVRNLSDLMFDPGFNYERLMKIKKSKLLRLRLIEEQNLLQKLLPH